VIVVESVPANPVRGIRTPAVDEDEVETVADDEVMPLARGSAAYVALISLSARDTDATEGSDNKKREGKESQAPHGRTLA